MTADTCCAFKRCGKDEFAASDEYHSGLTMFGHSHLIPCLLTLLPNLPITSCACWLPKRKTASNTVSMSHNPFISSSEKNRFTVFVPDLRHPLCVFRQASEGLRLRMRFWKIYVSRGKRLKIRRIGDPWRSQRSWVTSAKLIIAPLKNDHAA